MTASEAPITTPTPKPTPTETKTPEPSPTETEAEIVIAPEVQARLDAIEAMTSEEFQTLSVEERLMYQSWVLPTEKRKKFMNAWSDWNHTDEWWPGEPSASDTAVEAMTHVDAPFYAAFLKDSGAWDGFTRWDRNRAEKIYASTWLDGSASRFDVLFDWYEENGTFFKMFQVAGGALFAPLAIKTSTAYVDEAGRPCYELATVAGDNVMNVCLYDFTDYTGQDSQTWIIVAG